MNAAVSKNPAASRRRTSAPLSLAVSPLTQETILCHMCEKEARDGDSKKKNPSNFLRSGKYGFRSKRQFSDSNWLQKLTNLKGEKCPKHGSKYEEQTSWTFIQAAPTEQKKPEDHDNVFIGEKRNIQARIRPRKLEKQQVFSILPTSSLATRPDDPAADSLTRDGSLRQILLTKNAPQLRKNFVGSKEKEDVARSPGPVDGSLYAKVNKRNRLKESASVTSLPEYRKRSLETDELLQNASQIMLRKTSAGNARARRPLSDGRQHVIAREGLIHVDIKKGEVVASSQRNDSVTDDDHPDEPGYQTIEDLEETATDDKPVTKPLSFDFEFQNANAFRKADDATEADNYLKLNDKQIDRQRTQSDFAPGTMDFQLQDLKHFEQEPRKRISRIFAEKRQLEEDRIEVVLSKSVSLPCVNAEDMHASAKAHLTKDEIHDAISLINECLSDQQVRSGTLYPPPQGDSYFSLLHKRPSHFEQKTSYSMQNLNVQFLDQSSDPFDIAALEQCKDIKHAFVYSDDALDSVIAELAGVNYDYQADGKDPDSRRHTSSVDSGHSAEDSSRSPAESLQKTLSLSDVDSGIDGSALTASVSSEAKSTLPHYKGAPTITTPPPIGASEPSAAVEDEEERRVREEIEQMQKKLARLQEQQIKMKMQKRHSLDDHSSKQPTLNVNENIDKESMFYATLPKSPGKERRNSEVKSEGSKNVPNPRIKNVTKKTNLAKLKVTSSDESMMQAAYPQPVGSQYSDLESTSPGCKIPDPIMVERANAFTPSYAHPMHQPRHKLTSQYYQQQQREEMEKKRTQEAEKRNTDQLSGSGRAHKSLAQTQAVDTIVIQNRRFTDRQSPVSQPTAKSDELQSQLDELDQYINQLTQCAEPTGQSSTSLRRSYSCHTDTDVSKTGRQSSLGKKSESVRGNSARPPLPPTRSNSSYDSLSRSKSLFDSNSASKKSSSRQGIQPSSRGEENVFASSGTSPTTSFPPQTRHIRPYQQHVTTPPSIPKRPNNLEDKLSPQLFLAMSMNPGGRPVEEIHSYREDLEPLTELDGVDSALPHTPGFPVPPKTPYVNDKSPTGFFPNVFVKTPLSALNLKNQPNKAPLKRELSGRREDHPAVSIPSRRQNGHLNGPMINAKESRIGRLDDPRQNMSPQEGVQTHNSAKENDHTQSNDIKQTLLNTHSHDSGYADSHPNASSNGWISSTSTNNNTSLLNSSNGAHYTEQLKPPGPTFAYQSSPPAIPSRSLSGSNDSLLSDGSSSGHSHGAFHSQRRGSQPALPPKESSFRNGNSSRSTSFNSGYPVGSAQTSPGSNGPAPYAYASHQPLQKRESQMSSYDKQGPVQAALSSDDGLSSPTSARTSASSLSEIEKLAHDLSLSSPTPKFIKDTTSFWYKPDISRDQALALLRHRPAGSFVVRDSRCYPGAFGLALKVNQVPAAVLATAKPGVDLHDELVRHYLIEPSTRGVKLKGCPNEPVFGSLSALIYQHSITQLALPCKLVIPVENQEIPQQNGTGAQVNEVSNTAAELLRQGAACNVVYLGSVDTELLTGPEAVDRSILECLDNSEQKTSVVHFKVSPQGITLTDNARKIFFRRHYPTASVTFCGMDPSARNRHYDATKNRGPPNAKMFGFVAKKSGSSVDNQCHVFAELDLDQPARAIVNFVSKILIGSG